jgi:uncharacterized FlgJ-related protein
MRRRIRICLGLLATLLATACSSPPVAKEEVIVFGSVAAIQTWLKEEQWWQSRVDDGPPQVPRAILTGIAPGWQSAAQSITVPEKKEIFYRLMLPLVLHANQMVRERRGRLAAMGETLNAGGTLNADDLQRLQNAAVLLRILDESASAALGENQAEQNAVIDEALFRLDEIPPGLVLGQAAYESGYGTSRFAVEANALFGQWTFGEGLVPNQQRKQLGDHRIASFDWPFDSVRAYYLNLSSHPAYANFRQLRAQLKAKGKTVTSLSLADGLRSYSERGQAYVDTLKGIITTNQLDRADTAVFRDEDLRFLVTTDGEEKAAELRKEIEALRQSGELAEIIARMRLD